MISGITTWAVDTFRVVVERACDIDEHQHRRIAGVVFGERIRGRNRVTGT
jgi:hypothetical protein